MRWTFQAFHPLMDFSTKEIHSSGIHNIHTSHRITLHNVHLLPHVLWLCVAITQSPANPLHTWWWRYKELRYIEPKCSNEIQILIEQFYIVCANPYNWTKPHRQNHMWVQTAFGLSISKVHHFMCLWIHTSWQHIPT